VHEYFDAYFVQPWHGKHETQLRHKGMTSYSGQHRPGHWFAWYSDRPSKVTGEADCFHIEGRYQGVASLRKIGVHHPRALLSFDHQANWSKHMRLYLTKAAAHPTVWSDHLQLRSCHGMYSVPQDVAAWKRNPSVGATLC